MSSMRYYLCKHPNNNTVLDPLNRATLWRVYYCFSVHSFDNVALITINIK